MRRAILLLIVVSLVFITSCSLLPERSGQKVSVLSVGLDYKDSIYSDLPGTINDAKEVGMALKSLYDYRGIPCSLEYMLQEEYTVSYWDEKYPNRDNVLKAITTQDLDEDDLFVFFYAGHGETEKEGGMFLATGYDNTSYSKLEITSLLNAMKALPCRSVVILDSCYSGLLDPGVSKVEGNVSGMADPQNQNYPNSFSSSLHSILSDPWYGYGRVTVLASANAREKAGDGRIVEISGGKPEQHGYFTVELLRKLGWAHSVDVIEYENTNGKVIKINGKSTGVKGKIDMDSLYVSIMEEWKTSQQNPVLYDTIETVNLVPAN